MTSEIVRVKAFNNTAWVREEAGYNGKLYFQAAPDHGTAIYEDGQTHTAVIWETDGTEEGTKILHDFAPGPTKFVPSHIRTANNHLFFEIRIDEGPSRYELWSYKTNPQDPSEESSLTKLVYSLDGRFPDFRFDDNIEATKNGLFFLQTDENDLNELWFTNGSSGSENTYSLGGNEPGKPGSNFVRLAGADNRLYFIADGREIVPGSDESVYDPNELWSTTSQPGTFKKLSDFDYTCSASFCSPINHEKAIGDALYFTGRTEIDTGDTSGIYDRYVDDIEPWVSQGSDQTTAQIADVNPFRNPSNVPSGTISSQFTLFNGEIYFLGINNRDFNEDPSETLYAYSPESGVVRAVAQTAQEWRNHSYRELFVFNGFLYFSGQTEETGWELWRSDGTSQGTRFLKDIKSNGSSSSHPQDFTIHKKDRTLYSADDDDLYFHTEYGSVWKLSGQSGLIEEVEVDDSLWQGAGNITSVDLANGSTDLYFTSGQTIFTLDDQTVEEPEPTPEPCHTPESDNIHNSAPGKGKMKGGEGVDQFAFNAYDIFNKKGADKIINFKSTEGDFLSFTPIAIPGIASIDSFGFASATSKKQLKKLSKQDYEFVYFEKKGRLYFDSNGFEKGWGDPAEGGLVAIMKGKPELNAGDIVLLE